ncbi:MAG: hypothetical protein KAH48_02065 [Chlorobi bacterium]|nr:hypothetical protein [Chlorobiota bacterium]
MKILLILGLIFSMSIKVFGQINMNDSTVQAIGYWNMNEKQSYVVTGERYKIEGADTSSRNLLTYVVDITIVDSTADSYTIDWFFKDYNFNSDNEIANKLASIAENMTVRIKTNEMGVFQEVVNWTEIRDYIKKATSFFSEEFKDIPKMDKIIKQVEGMFSSKEAIELSASKSIQQYYTYHGGLYELGEEYTMDMKVANLYGGQPFDTKVRVSLEEIDIDNGSYTIRMHSAVDSVQLTNATFAYFTKMAKAMDVDPPQKQDLPTLTNDTWIISRIHESGWVLYSTATKEVKAEGKTSVEITTFEIQ